MDTTPRSGIPYPTNADPWRLVNDLRGAFLVVDGLPWRIGLTMKGYVSNKGALPTDAAVGDTWITADEGRAWSWGVKNVWIDLGILRGPIGLTPLISVAATTLDPGSPATVQRSGPDAAPSLMFGIPRGNTGATPLVTFVTGKTLPPGTSAKVTQTGTPENPLVTLDLPQGIPGDVPPTRKVSAGNGLIGGGDLSADRTLSVAYAAAAGWQSAVTVAGNARYVPTWSDNGTTGLTLNGQTITVVTPGIYTVTASVKAGWIAAATGGARELRIRKNGGEQRLGANDAATVNGGADIGGVSITASWGGKLAVGDVIDAEFWHNTSKAVVCDFQIVMHRIG